MNSINSVLDRISLWSGRTKALAIIGLFLVAGATAGGGSLLLRSSHTAGGDNVTPVPAALAASPSPSSAGPVASPEPGSVLAGVECRLPISNNLPGSGGFIVFPGGSFSPDQGSNLAIAGSFYELSYVRGARRWVPVPRSAIRPDGKAYAYYQGPGGILLVDIASGGQRSLGPQANGPASRSRIEQYAGWKILDAASEGVYAFPVGPSQTGGLWLFPYDGPEREVTGSGYWQAIGGGAAWGTVSASVPDGAENIILRHDLKSGAETAWFTRPGTNARVAGFDADGHPVIHGITATEDEIWLATASGTARRLASVVKAPTLVPGHFVQSVVGDSHGLWVTTKDGLYFARPGAALTKVGTITGFLAGECN